MRFSFVWNTNPEESIEYCKGTIPFFGKESVPVNITDSARVHAVAFVTKVKVGVGRGTGVGVGAGVGEGVAVGVGEGVGVGVDVGEPKA